MRAVLALASFSLLIHPALAQQPADGQTVMVGPWSIETTYKGEEFEHCTMSRSTPDFDVVFLRNGDGTVLVLKSPNWRLERGKAYDVRLSAGSQSIDATALAESTSVTIALPDQPFNKRLRMANRLNVHGEGADMTVPLDGSKAGLERLDQCFEKNSQGAASNPFVAPERRP
ncbi:MAG TPA: hypothetical protein VNS34_26970 [Rhizobiaceae bacterium]|nr:hypothetical protein [Rhizobiaceae bacterium]